MKMIQLEYDLPTGERFLFKVYNKGWNADTLTDKSKYDLCNLIDNAVNVMKAYKNMLVETKTITAPDVQECDATDAK